ncbi:hypothetical protein [Roseobacter sp. N2S]|uniref:hypothetical protein n=1 Tax=Roseobacter sp. N2S TaxID=2663844 RepID=UPI00285D34CB|nr:hypothetical protein [Roseobacter sp. N2S]MDR6266534.1 hypothetical protein [Roseobacter sp. N2S]
MTQETFVPTPIYYISGIGPYPVEHPFQQDSLRLYLSDSVAETETAIDIANFTVTPEASPDENGRGDVYLDSAFAAENDGLQLVIERATPIENGWEGVSGAREAGLEAQLDRLTQATQDLSQRLSAAAGQPRPYVPLSGAVDVDADNTDDFITAFEAALL